MLKVGNELLCKKTYHFVAFNKHINESKYYEISCIIDIIIYFDYYYWYSFSLDPNDYWVPLVLFLYTTRG